MPDELRLPDDLAAMEARLAAHAPPTNGLNRDELMYRAGWAACEASRQSIAVVPSSPAGRRRVAAWCGVSSALAASLAVACTLLVQSSQRPQAPGANLAAAPSFAAAPMVDSPPPVRRPRGGDVADYMTAIHRADGRRLPGAAWTMRNALGPLDAKPSMDTTMASDVGVPSPKTARELRQELLPSRNPVSTGAASPAFLWPWSARLFGEST